MYLLLPIIFAVILIICSHVYLKRIYSYWERKGVPHLKPTIPFGNLNGFTSDTHFSILLSEFYNQLKGKGILGGLYFYWRPIVMPLDGKLIKRILVTDFTYFEDRPVFRNEKVDPLSANLFFNEPDKWRALRRKLSPAFTSGKMKFMFPTILQVAENLKMHIANLIGKENDFFIQDSIGKFTVDVIGTCAFGIECNSLGNKNEDFLKMGLKSFTGRKISLQNVIILQVYTKLFQLMRLRIFPKDVADFFTKITRDTVEYRELNKIERNDFMDILIKLKNSIEDSITMQELTGQAFIFFVAGFETSATTMMYALYELSNNPNIQEKCREEIRTVIKKHNGEFSYEAMIDMKYLDNVITETLRAHPPGGQLVRKVTKDYRVPETNVILPIGTEIIVPIYGIHHDPDIYPNPEKFIPERFSTTDENRLWLPFGDGPRNCIGLRFGLMQIKIGLVTFLTKYRFSNSSKTQSSLIYDTGNPILSPKGGIWLKATEI